MNSKSNMKREEALKASEWPPKKAPVAQEEPQEKSEVLVVAVLDGSGSMAAQRDMTIRGFNEYLSTLRQDTKTEYRISLTVFRTGPGAGFSLSPFNANNMNDPQYTDVYLAEPLDTLANLTHAQYYCTGGTPLNDAIARAMHLHQAIRSQPVLCLIMTDGEENSSLEHPGSKGKEEIKRLVKNHSEKNWTFVFLGANIDAFQTADSYGMQRANSVLYSASASGQTMSSLGSNTMDFAALRRSTGTVGQNKGETYFSKADQDKISKFTDDAIDTIEKAAKKDLTKGEKPDKV